MLINLHINISRNLLRWLKEFGLKQANCYIFPCLFPFSLYASQMKSKSQRTGTINSGSYNSQLFITAVASTVLAKAPEANLVVSFKLTCTKTDHVNTTQL